ncbi:hypothetical protein CDB3_22035 [Bacillus sp. CDB3]|nr:hypothetical protein CDB3_22035 [Bacillus sp. CDB3]
MLYSKLRNLILCYIFDWQFPLHQVEEITYRILNYLRHYDYFQVRKDERLFFIEISVLNTIRNHIKGITI